MSGSDMHPSSRFRWTRAYALCPTLRVLRQENYISSDNDIKLALPPAAVVSTVNVRS